MRRDEEPDFRIVGAEGESTVIEGVDAEALQAGIDRLIGRLRDSSDARVKRLLAQRQRRDGWPRCPLLVEVGVAFAWMALNALDTALEAWDRHVNAAAFNDDDEKKEDE